MRRVGVILVLGLSMVACFVQGASVSGGGWGVSRSGNGKANFGLSLKCDEAAQTIKGHFVYNDKDAGSPWGTVNIKGDVDLSFGGNLICAQTPASTTFGGTYTAQNKACKTLGNCTGTFTMTATDTGNHGADKGDSLFISLSGGVYDTYSNGGPVEGGNLTVGN